MVKLFTAAVAALMLLVVPALAGDKSALTILGYSEDGRYFAFEEAGEFDGTGGFYDHIFIVDLTHDSWVKGTPFKFETDADVGSPTEDMTWWDAHEKVMAEAGPILKQLKIGVPADVINFLPDTIPNQDGKVMILDATACCFANNVDTSTETKLTLTTFAAKFEEDATYCHEGDDALGFKLTETYPDGTTFVLHEDGDKLPKSRLCPKDYRLYAVISPAVPSLAPELAIVSVYIYDFEGWSRRFMVVPLGKTEAAESHL
jgi:predicted secreted protein